MRGQAPGSQHRALVSRDATAAGQGQSLVGHLHQCFCSHLFFHSLSLSLLLLSTAASVRHLRLRRETWPQHTTSSTADLRACDWFCRLALRLTWRPHCTQDRHGTDGLLGRADYEWRHNPAACDESPAAGLVAHPSIHCPWLTDEHFQFDKSLADTMVKSVKNKTTLKVCPVPFQAFCSVPHTLGACRATSTPTVSATTYGRSL